MVAASRTDGRLLERVAEIYRRLERKLRLSEESAGRCRACGDCCDFDAFDHRLFITPPELEYLRASLGDDNLMPMTSGRCPYNVDGKCGVYEYRFAGCRIFCCSGDKDFQSELSERVLEELKSICEEFQIPYSYTHLAAALNGCAGG